MASVWEWSLHVVSIYYAERKKTLHDSFMELIEGRIWYSECRQDGSIHGDFLAQIVAPISKFFEYELHNCYTNYTPPRKHVSQPRSSENPNESFDNEPRTPLYHQPYMHISSLLLIWNMESRCSQNRLSWERELGINWWPEQIMPQGLPHAMQRGRLPLVNWIGFLLALWIWGKVVWPCLRVYLLLFVNQNFRRRHQGGGALSRDDGPDTAAACILLL